MGTATFIAKSILFLLAQIFGKTSPKSNIKKVTKTTSNVNRKAEDSISLKNLPLKEEKMITIAMLTKLLATKIVASNFFGFSKSLEIIFPFEGFSCKISSIFFCDKENSATSAPETNAEQNSNANIVIKPNTKSVFSEY